MIDAVVKIFTFHRNLALFLAFACACVLGFAYVAEYIFHYSPCPLCLWQRKPYFAVIALSLAVLALERKNPKISFYLLLACGLAFAIGIGVSGFHNGVEQGWWKGLDSCGDTKLPDSASIEELREYLHNKKITDCGVATWKFLGLSMTAYNFMMSVGFTAFTLFFALRGKKSA